MIFCFVSCIGRIFLKRDHWATTFIAGGFGGLSLAAEHPMRREEVAIWCFPRITEVVYHYLKKRGWVEAPNNSEIFVFSLAMGFMLFLMEKQPNLFGTTHKVVFSLIFGTN